MSYAFKLALIVAITVPASLLTIVIGVFDPHGAYVYRIGQAWSWLILRLSGITIEVTGLEQINPRQPYVFMANHQSHIDIPVLIQSLLAYQLRWIAKKELLWVPFFGWALWASKHIPVDRADRFDAAKSLRTARKRIQAGISVVVFPEGTRSKDGSLLRFRRGGVLLAVLTGTSIVPVTIKGSGQVLPAGSWRLRSGTIEVIIGEPLTVAGFRPGNLRGLSSRVREAIEKHLRPQTALVAESSWGIDPWTVDTTLLKKRSV